MSGERTSHLLLGVGLHLGLACMRRTLASVVVVVVAVVVVAIMVFHLQFHGAHGQASGGEGEARRGSEGRRVEGEGRRVEVEGRGGKASGREWKGRGVEGVPFHPQLDRAKWLLGVSPGWRAARLAAWGCRRRRPRWAGALRRRPA